MSIGQYLGKVIQSKNISQTQKGFDKRLLLHFFGYAHKKTERVKIKNNGI